MVQVGSPFSYDNDMEQGDKPDGSWTNLVSAAVKDFVASIGESSKQLAASAEKFADHSLHLIEDATESVQKSASASSDMAQAAREAADEARRTAEAIRNTIDEAGERGRDQARQAVQEATGRAEQAVVSGERLKKEIEQRVQEVLAQLEHALGVSQEAATNAQQSAQEARQIAESINTSLASNREASERAEEAAAQARQAAEEAGRAQAGGSDGSIAKGTQMVLERLETDYQLLTRLVQELHSRSTGLASHQASGPAQAAPPSEDAAAEPPAISQNVRPDSAPSQYSTPVAPATPRYQAYQSPVEDSAASSAGPEATAEPSPASNQAQAMPAEAPPVTISGRVLVSISPVPDFDRLLNLDGALGRLEEIRNVSLADYAKEEVTFRVEFERPVSSRDFSQQLSDAIGTIVEVVSASEGDVSLRLVA